jgi:FkbM family methyltransferase
MIPKILLQTSKNPYPQYVKDMWKDRIDETWTIEWFDDDMILEFFKDNPLPEFPDIIKVFHSFTKGPHKADLFRYYYMYLNGGVFIDSDCMTHVHLNDLVANNIDYFFTDTNGDLNGGIKLHEFKSSMFNGFFGCCENSELTYKLLKDLYYTPNSKLDENYLRVTGMMDLIVKETNPSKTVYYTCHLNRNGTQLYIYDKTGNRVCTHYHTKKVIPMTPIEKQNKISDLYVEILERQPDVGGLIHYNNLDLSIEQLRNIFLNSDEYLCKHKKTTFDSTEFTFHTHDRAKDLVISKCIHDAGEWEANISWIILNSMKEGELFVDIGANIGWHTKVVQNRGYNVIAFEPEPENFKLLMKNCNKEGSSLKNVALGDKTTSLFLRRDDINYGNTYVTESGEIKVDSVRLDDVLDKSVALRTSVVKMDTQGYETKIIQGGLEFFKNLKKGTVIVTEVSVWRPEFDLQLFLHTLHTNVTKSYALCHWWENEPKSLAETLDFISNNAPPVGIPNYFEFDLVIIK